MDTSTLKRRASAVLMGCLLSGGGGGGGGGGGWFQGPPAGGGLGGGVVDGDLVVVGALAPVEVVDPHRGGDVPEALHDRQAAAEVEPDEAVEHVHHVVEVVVGVERDPPPRAR